jgi:hypothetical protein
MPAVGSAATRQESARRLLSGSGQIIAAGRHRLLQADRSRTQAEYRVDAQLVQGFQSAADAAGDGETRHAERVARSATPAGALPNAV